MGGTVAIVSTVRDDLREVERFICYHLNQGVRYILLYIDVPSEWGAMAYSADPRVGIVLCDDHYWRRAGGRPAGLTQRQIYNANTGLTETRRLGADWITHIDQDELIIAAGGDIGAALDRCRGPVVRFEMLEAVDTGRVLKTRFHADTFKTNISAKDCSVLRTDPRLAGLFFEGEYFRGHTNSKSAYRIADFHGRIGVHGENGARSLVPTTSSIRLLHYDCVGEATWRAKWSMRKGDTSGFGMRDNRKAQLALFNSVEGDAAAERAAYQQLHMPTEAQIAEGLRRGIIDVVSIDHALFETLLTRDATPDALPVQDLPVPAGSPSGDAAPAVLPPVPAQPPAASTLRDDIVERLHDVDPFVGLDATGFALDLQGWNGRHPALTRSIRAIEARLCVDVGVWKGMSTLTLADAVGPDGVVIAVDTFLGSPEHWNRQRPDFIGSLRFRHGMPQIYWQFMANCMLSGLKDRIVPLPQTSANAALILKRQRIRADLVHIDAAHEFDSVLADIRAYFWHVLRPGGLMIGDDYNWDGVKRAVDQFTRNNHLTLETDGPKWMLRKPDPATAGQAGAAAAPPSETTE